MYVRYLNGTVIELVKAKFTKTIVQNVDVSQVPLTDLSIVRRLGLKWQEWVINGAVTYTTSVMWRDIAQVSLDNVSWRNCVTTSVDFPRILIDQTLYELRLNVSPLLEGAIVRYPTTGYKWGLQSISGISQAGNATAYPTIHFLAPLFYASLSNTLLDFTGQAVTFLRTASKVHGGITYPINTPIFDSGLYLASDTAQDVATWTPPASAVRTIAMQLKSRYPSPWVIGTGSPTNLVANGDFETDVAGWIGAQSTLSRETGSPLVGAGSLKVLMTSAVAGFANGYVNITGLTIGHVYVASGLVKATAASGRTNKVRALSNATQLTGVETDCVTAASQVTGTFTATWATASIGFSFNSNVVDEYYLLDSVVCYDLTAMSGRNLLTANQSNAETDATGMYASNGTLTRNTVMPLVGTGDFKMVAIGGTMALYPSTPLQIVAANLWYVGQVMVKGVGMVGGRQIQLFITWKNSAGTNITSSLSTSINCPTVATVLSITGQAPVGAVSAYCGVQVVSAVSGEILYADSFMFEAIPQYLNIYGSAHNTLFIDTYANLLDWTDGTTYVSLALPAAYLSGTVMDVVVEEDTAHAVTIAVHPAGGTWVRNPANLIANGDFETNTTGWTGESATLSLETVAPLVGTKSLKILMTGGGDAYTAFGSVAGHQYFLSMRVKSTAAVGKLTRIGRSDAPAIYCAAVDCSTEQTLTFTFSALDASTYVFVGIVSGIANEYLIVDSVTCYDITAQVSLAAITWPQLTLGNLEGSLANLIEYPYVLTQTEYQAIVYSSLSLLFNTLYIGNRYAGEIVKGSDKRLVNASGSDISALLGGVDIAIGEVANPLNPANLITNGEFEVNTVGWTGYNTTLSRETGSPLVGTGSLKILVTSSTAYDYSLFSTIIGHQYVATCRAKSTAAAGRLSVMRVDLTLTAGYVSGSSVNCSTEATLTIVFTATSTTTALEPILVNGLVDEYLIVDSVTCYDLTHAWTIAQLQGFSARWYVEVQRTDV